MQTKETCYLGFACNDFYNVVADVASYKQFLPWCTNSLVHSNTPDPQRPEVSNMAATLEVGFPPFFSEQYTSEVVLTKPSRITASLHEKDQGQTLETMVCNWEFTPNKASDKSTKVHFDLQFSFSNNAHEKLTKMVFDQVAGAMQDSFIKRCEQLHGAPSHAKMVIPTSAKDASASKSGSGGAATSKGWFG